MSVTLRPASVHLLLSALLSSAHTVSFEIDGRGCLQPFEAKRSSSLPPIFPPLFSTLTALLESCADLWGEVALWLSQARLSLARRLTDVSGGKAHPSRR